MEATWPRRLTLVGSLFLLGWGILHVFIPALGQFDQQLQGVPALTVDTILLVNLFASLCLITFAVLGVVTATRLWDNEAAVNLVLWPMGLLCLAYAAYMLVRPLRLPVADPLLSVAHAAYVVAPLALALCFLLPLWQRRRSIVNRQPISRPIPR